MPLSPMLSIEDGSLNGLHLKMDVLKIGQNSTSKFTIVTTKAWNGLNKQSYRIVFCRRICIRTRSLIIQKIWKWKKLLRCKMVFIREWIG